jgi:hypothetical protein
MSAESSPKRPLTQLNFDIEQAEADVSRLEAERRTVAKNVAKGRRRMRYVQLASAMRRPKAQFNLWPLAVMFLGPLICGIALLVITDLLTNSYPVSFFAFLLGIIAGVGLFASLVYHPPDTLLPEMIAEAESHLKLADARLKEKVERITETKQRLERLVDERRDQIASGKLQKAALLQRNWKSMRETEWQDFVVEVCRTLGAKVDRVAHVDDATLIADFGTRRVAVLTCSDDHNVSSATIHQAIAAREHHHSDSCAVIINRRFTGAAQDFAQRNNCTAIGAGEFPDFVMGKIEI